MKKDNPAVLVVARFRGVFDSAQAVLVHAVQTGSGQRLVFPNELSDGASSVTGGVRALEIHAA